MNKPKKAELMAEIGSFKTEKIALNERLARYQDELAAARLRISSMEDRISSMEERFEQIAALAAPPKAE
jgi:chromosome segregation ATPase